MANKSQQAPHKLADGPGIMRSASSLALWRRSPSLS